jgi:hypothetical protein
MSVPPRREKREDLPETFYAPARRATDEELRRAVAVVSRNPVIDTVMRTFGGLIAVLNENRQILAVNHALLEALGIEDAGPALGLRPGEAAGCVHAADHPGGCGTGPYCSDCGAAIAIVTAMGSSVPQERECALTVLRDGRTSDINFAVRCCPIEMAGMRLLLLFLRDVSEEKRQGALERTFFHDIQNLLTGLTLAGEMLAGTAGQDDTVKSIRQAIALLVKEVKVQRALALAEPGDCPLEPQETSVGEILDKIQLLYATHPVAVGKALHVVKPAEDVRLTTDPSLVLRVLMNAVTNALEAAQPGEEVRVWTEASGETASFFVWNREAIPEGVARRVFQRYFTTKPGAGRGVGTFAMKWLAEKHLQGEVGFTTGESGGTTFCLRIPRHL